MEKENIVQHLSKLLRGGTMSQVRSMLSGLHPAEIAQLLESLPIPKRRIVWELVDQAIEGEVLLHVNDESRANLIEMTNDHDLVIATEGLEIDDLADLLEDLPERVAKQALAGMNIQTRERLEKIMTYPEETAGSLMSPDTISIRDHVTLETVLHYLRMQQNIPKGTNSLMVVDYQNRYIGRLPLRYLVTKNPNTLVKEIMENTPQAISANEPIAVVVKLFEDRDLVSSAVVDENGHLIGRITIDDVVDVIRDEAQKERFGLAGISGEEDLFAPILSSVNKRAVWLGVNLITALLASWFISLFQDTLEKTIALAVLVPIVASMGGIAGYQTLTIIIRGIATGRIVKENSTLLVIREVSIGLLNGLLWATIVSLIVILWFDNAQIGWIIASAMITTLIFAAIAGVFIPIILKRLHIDPALAGGVVLTTITDIIGIITFLGLATLFLI